MFCDADDQLEEMALKKMLDAISNSTSQMVVGGFEYISINTLSNIIQNQKDYHRIDNEVDLLGNDEALFNFWTSNNMLSSCGKLYLTSIIHDNKIVFNPNQIVLEDYGFVIDYLSYCSRIQMIPDVVYRCFSYADSPFLKRRARVDFYDDVVVVARKLELFLNRTGLYATKRYFNASIYPTLKLSYDLLWSIPFQTLEERIQKYKRIKIAMSNPYFKRMIREYRWSCGWLEHFSLKHCSILGLLLVRVFRNFVT